MKRNKLEVDAIVGEIISNIQKENKKAMAEGRKLAIAKYNELKIDDLIKELKENVKFINAGLKRIKDQRKELDKLERTLEGAEDKAADDLIKSIGLQHSVWFVSKQSILKALTDKLSKTIDINKAKIERKVIMAGDEGAEVIVDNITKTFV